MQDMSSPGMFTGTACKSINDLNLTQENLEKVYYKNALLFLGDHGDRIAIYLDKKTDAAQHKVKNVEYANKRKDNISYIPSRISRL